VEGGVGIEDPQIVNGLFFLRDSLNLGALRDDELFVDHRIELEGIPRASWPHFEDYSGLGGLCHLLLLLPDAEKYLSTSGLFEALLKHIIGNQESDRGWPQSYSTIYVTAYYVEILALAVSKSK
jgi:hypothetical protein